MIANCSHDENGNYSGGQAGDQGGEYVRRTWYSQPWDYVLRYPDRTVASLIAELAGEAADNDMIGYDQSQRGTFWKHLEASDYRPSQITVACEADCSSSTAAIVKAAGHIYGVQAMMDVSEDICTSDEREALKAAGFAELRGYEYTATSDNLLAGDILLYEGHHTAINLDDGQNITPDPVEPLAETEVTVDNIRDMYSRHLGRLPDDVGLASWSGAAAAGASYADISQGIAGSPEGHERFVRRCYREILGRDPDPEGLASWIGAMADGMPAADVIQGFMDSPEYKNK